MNILSALLLNSGFRQIRNGEGGNFKRCICDDTFNSVLLNFLKNKTVSPFNVRKVLETRTGLSCPSKKTEALLLWKSLRSLFNVGSSKSDQHVFEKSNSMKDNKFKSGSSISSLYSKKRSLFRKISKKYGNFASWFGCSDLTGILELLTQFDGKRRTSEIRFRFFDAGYERELKRGKGHEFQRVAPQNLGQIFAEAPGQIMNHYSYITDGKSSQIALKSSFSEYTDKKLETEKHRFFFEAEKIRIGTGHWGCCKESNVFDKEVNLLHLENKRELELVKGAYRRNNGIHGEVLADFRSLKGSRFLLTISGITFRGGNSTKYSELQSFSDENLEMHQRLKREKTLSFLKGKSVYRSCPSKFTRPEVIKSARLPFPPGKFPAPGRAIVDRSLPSPVHPFSDSVPSPHLLLSDSSTPIQPPIKTGGGNDSSIQLYTFPPDPLFTYSFNPSSGSDQTLPEGREGAHHSQNSQESTGFHLSYIDRELKLLASLRGKVLNLNISGAFRVEPSTMRELSAVIENSGFVPGRIVLRPKKERYALFKGKVSEELELRV